MNAYRWRYRADEPRRSELLAFVKALSLDAQVEHRHSVNLECEPPLIGGPLAVLGGRFEIRMMAVSGIKRRLFYLFDPRGQEAEITLLGYFEPTLSDDAFVQEATRCLGYLPEPVELPWRTGMERG